ncbi:MAG TPA: CRISPR-associated helicase Cas3' [Abditibacteriaceae bacterium]|jgi:CRISPR-associated endonuclease/helicase Cas3
MSEHVSRLLWAKSDPYHQLWRHLLDVAAVVQVLWPRFGPVETMPPRWAAYICALHDVGKADPYFQNKNESLAAELRAFIEIPSRDDKRIQDTMSDIQRYFRHEARSSEWLQAHLMKQHGWGKPATDVTTMAISGHHGTFGERTYEEQNACPKQYATWQPLREELAQMLWTVLEPPSYTSKEFAHAVTTGMMLSGLVILADWIASNHEVFNYRTLHCHNEPQKYFEASRELAQQTIDRLELLPVPQTVAPKLAFEHVWPLLPKELRPSQQALQDLILQGGIAPGLAIIEAQMGEGKTEAAIYLAEHWNAQRHTSGAYVALPTQATSNQMHGRYRKYLQDRRPGQHTRLVHGMAWLVDEASRAEPSLVNEGATPAEEAALENERRMFHEWFRPLRRALLASDGVGTVDQALMAALHVKFGALRLLGLRSKVLIVDEVHAYDAYMNTILKHLLQWCRALEIPVILLSATLSHRQKQELIAAYGGRTQELTSDQPEAYPLLTFVATDGTTRTVEVESKQHRTLDLIPHVGWLDNVDAIAELALKRIESGGCACVLMNSVKGAQDVFSAVQRLLKNKADKALAKENLILFHARFRAEAREEIEKLIEARFGKDATLEAGTRPQRALVIGTQVLEQSLDIDFDFFISQLAPVDLLLQRSGRMWRHKRKRPFGQKPTLEVLLPPAGIWEFGVSQKIYAPEVLLRTLGVLHGREEIKLPWQFRPLIEAVYSEQIPDLSPVPPEIISEAAAKHHAKVSIEAGKAKLHLLPSPSSRSFDMKRRTADESDEQEGANYLRASTRLGNDSRPALLLRDPNHIKSAQEATAKSRAPRRDIQKTMFRQKVNVPCWWLRDTKAAEGYTDVFQGEGWLGHHLIIPLKDDEWHAANGAVIRDDEALGVIYEAKTDKAKAEEMEEADAGYTT